MSIELELRLSMKDDSLNDLPDVREWLDEVAQVIKEKMGI